MLFSHGFGMLPISGLAVLSMALYKAEYEALQINGDLKDLTAKSIPAVAFLRFMDCASMLAPPETNDTLLHEQFAVLLHTEYMQSVIYATVALLLILAIRAIFTDLWLESDNDVTFDYCMKLLRC